MRELSSSGSSVEQQRGLGYCFVNRSDLTPPPSDPYDLDDLLDRMAQSAGGHLSTIGAD